MNARELFVLESDQPRVLLRHATTALQELKRSLAYTALVVNDPQPLRVLDSVRIDAVHGGIRWTTTMPASALEGMWDFASHAFAVAPFAG